MCPPPTAPPQTHLGFAGCVSISVTPTLKPSWELLDVLLRPPPASAHLQPLTALQPSSQGSVTVRGHPRGQATGRACGHTLLHHLAPA